MSETKEESLAYILKFHSEDIKWHREDVANKVRRKKYDWQFKLILMSHLERFKGYQELSDVTGIDVGILKQWIQASIYKERRSKNQEFQHLKVVNRPPHTSYKRKSY